MKKPTIILVLGLLAAVLGFGTFYFVGTASNRALLHEQSPELAWLKKQFNLTEAEFARVSELHAGYLPACRERCHRIAAKEAELKDLLSKSKTLTPDIEKKVEEAAQLRVECQTAMLKHFYAVSQTMPPAEGQRYLAWVQEKTFLSDHGMRSTSESSSLPHDHQHE